MTSPPSQTMNMNICFIPSRVVPKISIAAASPIRIRVRTEPLFGGTHDVFFNRGVASSQAYVRRFGNRPA